MNGGGANPADSRLTQSREPVYGQCFGCGAVAWELLNGASDYCMDCDPASYRDDEDDPCANCACGGDCACEWDQP